ncbi:hypothetical protein [Cellulomonas hominis]
MRRATFRAASAGLFALLLLVAVVGGVEVRAPVDIPDEGPWIVLVGGDPDRVWSCIDDPAVATTVMAAVWPADGISLYLVADARRLDAERVLRCVVAHVDPSDVHVATNPSPLPASP